ncbi:PLP-dependent aminotransferase family protein [Chromobacterium sp. IIBBL 290-4]|uniref:MocR-like pyridoxine biosynthesis transcription factor PdxR n=1 Tax=Chromobacterium sp. IIBBL 290-4 TaxID=2953890 RepID=UPI0020B79BC4|nr:PLP-dependent aminotransferase family protein [Chromobacterium sp. IIBBL 290-4]UTH76498.1 PLP-dependent aminotransferase family protein [Chromobacterium sp. IIBBL 290-4]
MNQDWLSAFLKPKLQRKLTENLSRQLYRLLKELIRHGRLQAGSAIPASRQLAEELKLGRNTVLAAYEQLSAEGYLESRHGSGTYVCQAFAATRAPSALRAPRRPLSRRGASLHEASRLPHNKMGAFIPGQPDLALFPIEQWQKCLSRSQRTAPQEWMHYQREGGLPALRHALAEYLFLTRSVQCKPEQILITSGSQAGLALIAKLLADAGDAVWLEEPGYAGAQAAMLESGLISHPIAVDEEGMALPSRAPTPRLIYATPAHQYPTGAVMSLSRRVAWLNLARQHDCWIIEDDYDGEFCHSANPLAALQSLDQDNRVIYLGTFSKVMFPALKLGYLVLPPELVEPFRQCQARLHGETHYLQQAALADFIERGHFAHHIRAMREIYARRQQLLRHAVQSLLGDSLPLSGGGAGMHLLASLPKHFDEWELQLAAAQQGLWLRPLARHYQSAPDRNGLVLGYAGVPDERILPATQTLAQLLETRLK